MPFTDLLDGYFCEWLIWRNDEPLCINPGGYIECNHSSDEDVLGL